MNLAPVEPIVKAVLYEGYILYPYRPTSVKNRQRWTFGGVYPCDYAALDPSSPANMQTECLMRGDLHSEIAVHVRFLQIIRRDIGELPVPQMDLPADSEPSHIKVQSLRIADRTVHSWEEAKERDVAPPAVTLEKLIRQPISYSFSFAGERSSEPLRLPDGRIAGLFMRSSADLRGELTIAGTEIAAGIFKLTVRIDNTTPLDIVQVASRGEVQLRAFASTHTILGVGKGQFISLLDPPAELAEAAAACANQGTWPVLVGEPAAHDTILSSPIILYDYPVVAPESPGDLFDGTEIDEILTLRILAMTDEEKREMSGIEEQARALLERTEALTAADMARLHGTVRDRKPELGFIQVGGRDLKVGDRVRLSPKRKADIMDIVLKNEVAVIEAIERDFEDQVHVAVVLEADPGREFGLDRMPGHRFFFSPDEIEPLDTEGRP